jgi:predicted nuclease of restriction endonuclease-like RecB superfamily
LVSDRPRNSDPAPRPAVPHFLDARDHPWLRCLIEEYERFVGRPQRDLDARLRQPLPCVSPPEKLKLAIEALSRARRGRRTAAIVPPKRARALVFAEAARTLAAPEAALSTVAESLGITRIALRDSLFADLPGERLVAAPARPISPTELACRTNLALVQRLLFRATRLRIDVEGNTRAVVRQAKWRGLICIVTDRPERGGASLEISGPFALFRHTGLYGRALGELVPLLGWCSRFSLVADCVLDGRPRTLRVETGDPVFPGDPPRCYDSHLEERFAREFRRMAPDWDIVREPEPIPAGETLIFPDFALHRRSDPGQRWLLEIVGFWTPDYVARKVALYQKAPVANLVLCIDEARSCSSADLPMGTRVVRFRKRIDPADVLRAVGASPDPVESDLQIRHPPHGVPRRLSSRRRPAATDSSTCAECLEPPLVRKTRGVRTQDMAEDLRRLRAHVAQLPIQLRSVFS